MSTTHKANGAAGIGPVRVQRTGADVVADVVSLVILAALGAFAVAVSFSHTKTFVREHGQTTEWIVVGTACTVVLLTLQSGMETFRDSRAGRGRGWPAVLLAVGVGVELYANMATAEGGLLNKAVAGWPVPVAAAALALFTRRLQHAAEAAEQALLLAPAERPRPPVEQLPVPPVERAAEHPPIEDDDQEQEHDQEQEDDQEGTVKDRVLRLLRESDDVPGPTEVARKIGCTRQYAHEVIRAWREDQPIQGQQTLDWERTAVGA
ncbi:hypothetical protein [Streptomyces zaomyceticus]|uniref:hypothetical protein n=1 Tax=Streptomyces zaomyceticus TaxID=68286 RepID=UPI003677BBE5